MLIPFQGGLKENVQKCQDCFPQHRDKVLGKSDNGESDGMSLVNETNLNQVHIVPTVSRASSSSPAGQIDEMVVTRMQEPY